MVGSITFTKIPLSLFALISWSPKRAHWCFSDLQWCVLSSSGVWTWIDDHLSQITDVCLLCVLSLSDLECSCDQCLFTPTLPSLSRSHESDSLLPRSVCLFKIERHQIWGSHGVGGCVRPVLCFLELVDRPNHQLVNVLFGWTGLRVFWFLVCVVSSPSFIWDGQKFALDGTRISQLPKFKLLNLIRNWNFTKKRDSCDNFVLNQPLLRSPDAPPALAAAGQLADYHLCGTDTRVGWTHGADSRSKTNICLDRSYQSAHHHCNTTLLHNFDQNIRQDRSQQMFARCGHNIKPGTNDDRFAPREPTHNELFSIWFPPTFPCFLFLVFSFSLTFGFKPKCILIGCWAVLLGPEVSQCPSVPVSQVAQVFSNGSVRDTVSPNDKLGTSPGNALTDFAVLGSAK